MTSPHETRLGQELREIVSAQPFSPDTDVIGQRARKKRRQRAVAVRSAVSAGAAVVVAGGVFGAVHGTGGTATGVAASPTVKPVSGASQLMSLAASVTTTSGSQSGDASFVVMSPSLGGTSLPSTYDLYGDNGALYSDYSKSDIPASVAGGQVITDPVEANEVAVAKYAATGDITAARGKMAAILNSYEQKGTWQEERQKSWIKLALGKGGGVATFQQLLKANPGVRTDASAGKDTADVTSASIWNGSVTALTAGAGNSQVRAGVLRLLATVPGVKVAKSTTGGEATLTLSASSSVLDGGSAEMLVIDAATGSPVQFSAAAGEGMQAAKATYKVSRVTLADVAKGKF
jgi:hypothetical protein